MSKLMINFVGSTLTYNLYYTDSSGRTTMLHSLPVDNIPSALAYHANDKGANEIVLVGTPAYTQKIGKDIDNELLTKYNKNDVTITYMEA